MIQIKKLLRATHLYVSLGLLTLFLIVNTVTVLAHSPSLIDRGRISFDSGRFAEAAEIWHDAVQVFANKGDEINQARTLSYLSLAYQNLGDWPQAENAITKSLKIIEQLEQSKKGNARLKAIALNTQGSLQISIGQTEAALLSWEKAEKAYAADKDITGIIGSKINQAQALQALGFYRKSQKLLREVNRDLQTQPDSLLKVKALENLGVSLQLVGNLSESQEVLQQALAMQEGMGSTTGTSDILLNLANTARDNKQKSAALQYYQQAIAKTTNPGVQLSALLNQFSIYVENSQPESAIALLAEIESKLNNLSPSRMSVYTGVNFARNLDILETNFQDKIRTKIQNPKSKIAEILARAIQQAENLKDMRAKAYALTELGKLYSQTEQFFDALKLTQEALSISQGINASDIAYQASWQLGRILKQQGKVQEAIAAYDSAVKTLKTLRTDLATINPDVQFSFQESVEPVYRQLMGLLLQSPENQNNLKRAREVIEGLQLAELDNFFREACLDAKPQQIDQIDKQAAVIYPIILADRLEVILSLPGQPLLSYRTNIAQNETEAAIKRMRRSLNPAFSSRERSKLYQQLYDWLIRPAEAQLANSGIKTLVFVLDGSLRNLPMPALYDGKQYLLEKYSIALSPGMQLMESRSLKREQLKMITAGLSEARQGFQALPGVKSEVTEIASKTSTKVLLNESFTNSNLQLAIKSSPFSVLHLATHAQFSSRSDETFILTWDGRINVKQLDELLQSRNEIDNNPVELMVMSACQTAKGDNRAILGLAGVAVRSGARSTVATLWAVEDESTAKFMVEFYKQLKQPGVSKALALRKAQLSFLESQDFQHPYYWASFVLIGNWL